MREESFVYAGLRFALQGDSADGSGGVLVGQGKEAATLALFHGHVRNYGDAKPGGDHTEDAAELAAFEDDLRIHAGAIAGGHGGFAEAVPVAKEKEGIGFEFAEGERAAVGERVLFREDGKKFFGDEGKRFEFVAVDLQGKGDDSDVHATGAKFFKEQRGNFLDDGEAGLGPFA